MHIAATWLALEDVHPGSGELEYYVGSHRAPDFRFGGALKWMENHPEENPKFLQSLHDDAVAYKYLKRSFLGKRGDVLIWHADIAHGGASITRDGQTRRSFMTHFTSARDEPFYRRYTQCQPLENEACLFVSQFADIQTAPANAPETVWI